MNRRLVAAVIAIAGAVLLLGYFFVVFHPSRVAAADGKRLAASGATSDGFFGATKLWSIDLEISAQEYEAMQPPTMRFGPPATPPAAKNPKDKRESERNLFGVEFPWIQANLTADGKTYKTVGIRYSGEMTYFASSQGLKRPLKIEFNKFADQRFHGLASLQLHSMTMDPAKGREALAYSIFRAAGVPAPRTAFAEVTLTVPGKYERERLGLYTVVENIDRTFLDDRFGAGNGLLMKPFQVRNVEPFGDDWNRYKAFYRPQSEPSKDEAKRVMAFAALINKASDDEFKREIESYLDVDAFLRFLAANALTSNLESAFALGHNYFLYLNPKTNKFVFLPGDLEFAEANFLLMGTADQLMDLSLTHPYPGENKLVD